VPRRNLVPLVLLAVLALLTAGFAALAVSAAPPTGSVIVQNATAQTLGSPPGTTSFTLELSTALAGAGGAAGTTVHLINYKPPDRMAVFQVTPTEAPLGLLSPAAITCVLSSYSAIVEGTAAWKATGSTYTRTESLQEFSARVPKPNGRTCAPRQSAAHGQVVEQAVVRSGYLIALRTTTVVPAQTLPGGSQATAGTQTETFVFLVINGTSSRKLIS
jgi:hypothetical protein